MSASTFANKFYPFSLGLSLLSAIVLSLPQSVQASPQDGIYLDRRTIPTSELPAEVANSVLENASTTSGLPVSSKLPAFAKSHGQMVAWDGENQRECVSPLPNVSYIPIRFT
ncbi:hypothetical protein K4039_14835 [Lyngbya sp. CCAP 1446/10]|uniref:hypothetical protein n=1 Tax=Lyngbya sp. CCAP 1446/10 TaxID=439293 RepID=UPI0022377C09|nr:hypothetical protein [Lyngbya sp. CCAP 1446/10]MCW6051329.1 hypothetical protein [Lyngbya sp. CCAP 1446/10]